MKHYGKNELIELTSKNHIQYEFLLSKIASYLYVETAHSTTTNNWTTYFDEIEECFELPAGFIDEQVADDIETEIYELFPDQIAEIDIVYETGDNDKQGNRFFDITLYDAYIPGYTEIDACIEENEY